MPFGHASNVKGVADVADSPRSATATCRRWDDNDQRESERNTRVATPLTIASIPGMVTAKGFVDQTLWGLACQSQLLSFIGGGMGRWRDSGSW
jgi:hypothetical protein